MPISSVRLVLTMLLFVCSPLAFAFIGAIFDELLDLHYRTAWGISAVITPLFFTASWMGIWIVGQPNWRQMGLRGAVVGLLAAIAGLLIAAMTHAVFQDSEPAWLFGDLGFAIALVLGSSLLWREKPQQRAARLAQSGIGLAMCPSCQYNLAQQLDGKCPECGNEHTLNEILAHTLRRTLDL